eukprot:scaffold41861_cov53-Attheya_sp.AAC.2
MSSSLLLVEQTIPAAQDLGTSHDESGEDGVSRKASSSAHHNERNNNDILREQFERDGFMCVTQVLSQTKVTELRESAERNFEECFQIMHQQGHVPFPQHCNKDENNDEKHTNNDNNGRSHYAMKCGVPNGFAEMVMRSPGRYEMTFGCDQEPFSGIMDELSFGLQDNNNNNN